MTAAAIVSCGCIRGSTHARASRFSARCARCPFMRWFPSSTGQGIRPESWVGGDDGTDDPTLVGEAEGGAAALSDQGGEEAGGRLPGVRPQAVRGRGMDGELPEVRGARSQGECGGRGRDPREGDPGSQGEDRRAGAGAGRPKKMGCSQRPRRDGLLTLQSEMRAEGKEISITKLCRWFGVPRSSFYYEPETPGEPAIDEELVETIRGVIEAEPAFGLRRITAVVRRKLLRAVNRKRVHRVLKLNGWQIWRKPQGKRPRAQGWASRATRSNERWA